MRDGKERSDEQKVVSFRAMQYTGGAQQWRGAKRRDKGYF